MSFKNAQQFKLKNQTLKLLPQKALFWKDQKMLVVSDVHLGKSGHFRKHGIAVPNSVNESNITRLNELVEKTQPEKILFLGDLFHSESNNEIEQFKEWRQAHAATEMILTIGNHDLLTGFEYEKMGLNCVNQFHATPFTFLHDESENRGSNSYCISGHIHPAVKLKGKGRQQLYVPCFYFGKQAALLPAFGSFTGSYRINPAQNESVFAIVEQEIIQISVNS
ncbi:ligase-associated DNA damage response endonuclease PdeM [Gracilimonas sediminicola]|uniref:Ligase-associated DNA damage response endonuclease PdeM n=1 Tax=Gracilimonas sediminicola TaxID=2952158 RepID=A0A9X2RGH3_9BACT|nr:ligase-associated DNA damage response endonuclease PdeM [Gracilimonas sediminicola]MCP9292362.1 ligase-associated DNA damage response endonuclease PdeM [Gracilimonas sediminicola]